MLILLILIIIVLLVLLLRPSFRNQKPSHYQDQEPRFDPQTHLNGAMLCEGVIYGPLGRVATRFVAEMEGEWDGNSGILRENFRYPDGNTQQREWRLTLGENGKITGEADDIIGQASGEAAGNALVLRYRLKLAESAGGHVLDVVDWLYLMENGVIINKSEMRKYGIKVGELIANMRPKP